jgi:glycosyltransferase involved in cell wall biosynthesis
MSQPFFSIVIPTLNEEKYLPALLRDLSKQKERNFEVIHVDGHSDDQTLQKAQEFSTIISLKSLSSTKRNVSIQRNLGAKASQGPWIIFMDADNRIPSNFLSSLRQQLKEHPEIDLFTTWIDQKNPKNPSHRIILSILNIGLDLYQNLNKPASFGALIGCRKQVFASVQFDEKQKVLEDSLFVKEACKKGFQFHIFHQPTFSYSLRRLQKEGLLKLALQVLQLQQMYLRGKDFQKIDHGYFMNGGSYYQQKQKKKISLRKNLEKFFEELN